MTEPQTRHRARTPVPVLLLAAGLLLVLLVQAAIAYLLVDNPQQPGFLWSAQLATSLLLIALLGLGFFYLQRRVFQPLALLRKEADGFTTGDSQPHSKKSVLHEESDKLLRMEERVLLANELHDSFAQTLAALRFHVRGLDESLHGNDECAVWEELERVENSLEEANRDLRELIAYFRKPSTDYNNVPGIEAVVSRFRRDTDISIFLQNQWMNASLPKETEQEVVRIIQEALANVRKHSNAQTARVMLRNKPAGSYLVLIEDDGIGFSQPLDTGHVGEHIGLTIMEERAQKINGTLRIEGEPGDGTRILLEFRHVTEESLDLVASTPTTLY